MPAPEEYNVTPTPYPASTKSSLAYIRGTETIATTRYFSDKIMVTVSQKGRLAHWVHIPLDISATDNTLTATPYIEQDSDDDNPPSTLLPSHHLTATTILGGTQPALSILGQTIATQIASLITMRDATEKRMVVVGMGLERDMRGREEYSQLVGLVLSVL
ncbi:hypothetical protein CC78DRAFT_519431 [Lojkania enalia]|uniref:Proteasome assembly chaperone 3 n=1 Tax=Lojkania enalia TaxID=147567 RepID=A0A9P4KAC6_9PLEO|nr:hypothetical protein CC78DRAFT_519431 [Didymosphaeria enalia]